MQQLASRTVLITGASAGIGRACAHRFAEAGAALVLAARREERLSDLAEELRRTYQASVHNLVLDIRQREQVQQAIHSLPKEFGQVDILINNAGLARGLDPLYEIPARDWEEMIDTNIKGLLNISQILIPGMIERLQGHVINIGSIAGHQVYPGGSVYCATKHAVRALSEGMKIDLTGTPVRVTSIDPGLVETEFAGVRFRGDESKAAATYAGMKPLTGDDIADIALFVATRPAHVNIADVIVFPTDQSSALHVHRDPERS